MNFFGVLIIFLAFIWQSFRIYRYFKLFFKLLGKLDHYFFGDVLNYKWNRFLISALFVYPKSGVVCKLGLPIHCNLLSFNINKGLAKINAKEDNYFLNRSSVTQYLNKYRPDFTKEQVKEVWKLLKPNRLHYGFIQDFDNFSIFHGLTSSDSSVCKSNAKMEIYDPVLNEIVFLKVEISNIPSSVCMTLNTPILKSQSVVMKPPCLIPKSDLEIDFNNKEAKEILYGEEYNLNKDFRLCGKYITNSSENKVLVNDLSCARNDMEQSQIISKAGGVDFRPFGEGTIDIARKVDNFFELL